MLFGEVSCDLSVLQVLHVYKERCYNLLRHIRAKPAVASSMSYVLVSSA